MVLAIHGDYHVNHKMIQDSYKVQRDGSVTKSRLLHALDNRSTKQVSNSMDPLLRNGADPKVVVKIPLNPVNSSFGIVTANINNQMSMKDMVRRRSRESNSDIVIVFAVRRPGCGACREHGLQLSELAKHDKNISFAGVVKETGSKDVDENLLEFYQDYFKFPLFKDEKWSIYEAMGNRSVSKTLVLSTLVKLLGRFRKNNIKSKMGGDHFTQGGILIFDRKGDLQYTYYEQYGEILDMNVIKQAINEILQGKLGEVTESTTTESVSETMSLGNKSS